MEFVSYIPNIVVVLSIIYVHLDIVLSVFHLIGMAPYEIRKMRSRVDIPFLFGSLLVMGYLYVSRGISEVFTICLLCGGLRFYIRVEHFIRQTRIFLDESDHGDQKQTAAMDTVTDSYVSLDE